MKFYEFQTNNRAQKNFQDDYALIRQTLLQATDQTLQQHKVKIIGGEFYRRLYFKLMSAGKNTILPQEITALVAELGGNKTENFVKDLANNYKQAINETFQLELNRRFS